MVEKEDVKAYFGFYHPTVLRYNKKTLTDDYYAINFGECKGMTFDRVMIYPNGVLKDFLIKGKKIDKPQKYYVAATRAKYSIAFVLDKLPKETENLRREQIELNEDIVNVIRYIPTK